MIIVKIQGGLGNQLFQFAFAHEMARRDADVYLDDRLYTRKQVHAGFQLREHVQLPFPIASRQELDRLKLASNWQVHRFLWQFHPSYRRRVVLEDQTRFSPDYLEHRDVFYDGYWQDERYFRNARDDVRRAIAATALDDQNHALREQIRGVEAVSVHVRRGDYLKVPNFAGICDLAYYERALAYVRERVPHAEFFVFSDDPTWCRENLSLPDATYVDHNTGSRAMYDLLLMAACKHNIIANSTFSWWGAWLDDRDEKVVVAPTRWFNQPDREMILPAAWKRL